MTEKYKVYKFCLKKATRRHCVVVQAPNLKKAWKIFKDKRITVKRLK